jgi:hypothetical protein
MEPTPPIGLKLSLDSEAVAGDSIDGKKSLMSQSFTRESLQVAGLTIVKYGCIWLEKTIPPFHVTILQSDYRSLHRWFFQLLQHSARPSGLVFC